MEQDNSWINAIYSIILEGQQIITGTLSYTVMICTTVLFYNLIRYTRTKPCEKK